MKIQKRLVLIAVCLYCSALAVLCFGQRQIMYPASAVRTEPVAAQAEDVTLDTADGENVMVWHVPPSVEKPVVIRSLMAPILVLHGVRVQAVPFEFGARLFAMAPAPKRFVRFPEGRHEDLERHGAVAAVLAFLAEPQP